MVNPNAQRSVITLFSLAICFSSWAYHKTTTPELRLDVSDDLLHAISGSIASACSITLFYPLETVRTRVQVDCTSGRKSSGSSLRLLYRIALDKNEGVAALYRGWSSLVMALVCLNFVYFYCFRAFRRWFERCALDYWLISDEDTSKYKIAIDLVAGYLAGVMGVLLTGPLWLVNTRLKLQGLDIGEKSNTNSNPKKNAENCTTGKKYLGILHCMYTISREEGILALWNGTTTSIILSLNPAIQLGVYELLKRHHTIITNISSILTSMIPYAIQEDNVKGNSLSTNAFEPFMNALLAKFLATIVTYPIQVLQTRHRAGMNTKRQSIVIGWIHDLRNIIKQHGLSGLYRGLESKLLQTLLNSGFMFLIYENLVAFLRTIISDVS